ncbi:MAG: helix-turn-helix domain-containing protein [Phycisphaerae bacterium]
MSKHRLSLSDQLRQAIDKSGMSRYRICQILQISQGHFSRFMHGDAGFSIEHLDELADLLDLHIVRGDATRKEN